MMIEAHVYCVCIICNACAILAYIWYMGTYSMFRNAMYNSGANTEEEPDRYTRMMMLNGLPVMWNHLVELTRWRASGWEVFGLSQETVALNNFSKMKVGLMEKVSY